MLQSIDLRTVDKWTTFAPGAAVQVEIRVYREETGFVARVPRIQEITRRGMTVSIAYESAARDVESWLRVHSVFPEGKQDCDTEFDDDNLVATLIHVFRRDFSSDAEWMAEHIDHIYDDSEMTPEDMNAYHRAKLLPRNQRRPTPIPEQ